MRNALLMMLISGLSVAPLFWLVLGLIDGLIGDLRGWLIFGLIFGLMLGLLGYGGVAVVQHYTLRRLLAWAGALPYPLRDSRLVAFLDAMHERILLRRVGGGWIFVHRSLLEYFASLSPNDP